MKNKVDNRTFQFCSNCSDMHIRVGDTLCIDMCNEIHCCAVCGFSSAPDVDISVSLLSERLDDGKYDRDNDNGLARYVYDYKILEDCDLSQYQCMSSEDFTAAIDSGQKTLSGWGTGGRDQDNSITDQEVKEVVDSLIKLYSGNENDRIGLISQLTP